jgi:CBS domain-containing protein
MSAQSSEQRGEQHRGTPLEIRNLHVVSGSGQVTDFRTVRCPVHFRTVPLQECLACPGSGGVEQGHAGRAEYASCHDAWPCEDLAWAPRPDAGPAFDHTPVWAVMTAQVLAVRPDVSLEAVTSLVLERGISGIPVVDAEGHPIGMVSKTDLLDERFVAGDTGEDQALGREASRGHFRVVLEPGVHAEALPYASVADAMTQAALTVPETAPVARAAALMAARDIHRLLAVSDDGKVAGIVTSSDIVRWVAKRGGYLRLEA